MSERRRAKYTLSELAALGGVSTRTLRYYLGEGLLPPPLGRGPGAHYDDAHLTRLQSVQYHQALGMELAAIKRHFAHHYATSALNRGEFPPPLDLDLTEAGPEAASALPKAVPESWIRIELAPGLELHVSSAHRLPMAPALGHIALTCRELLGIQSENEDGSD
jgi:DNA-binding transcriptional MerR regulator